MDPGDATQSTDHWKLTVYPFVLGSEFLPYHLLWKVTSRLRARSFRILNELFCLAFSRQLLPNNKTFQLYDIRRESSTIIKYGQVLL